MSPVAIRGFGGEEQLRRRLPGFLEIHDDSPKVVKVCECPHQG